MIPALNSASDVEVLVATNPETLSTTDARDVAVKLQAFLNTENNGLNSKIRRKASRFLAAISSSDNQSAEKSTLSSSQRTISMDDSQISSLVQALSQATVLREVEAAMNSFDFQKGFTELDVGDNRHILKDQLNKTLQLPIHLNKPIRRRIDRLLFVASTKDEQQEIKSKPKPAITSTKVFSNTKGVMKPSDHSQSPFQKAAETSKLLELPVRLSNAKSGIELETHLNSLSDINIEESGIDESQKGKLIEALEAVLTDAHPLKESLNAKSRRRVKRLIERVRSPPPSTSDGQLVTTSKPTEKHAHKSIAPVIPTHRVENQRPIISGDKSKPITSSAAMVPVDNTPNWAARVIGLRTSEGLDSLLDTLTEAPVETYSGPTKQSLSEALTAVQANRALVKNAKQRRKVARLIDRLSSESVAMFGEKKVGTWDEDSDKKRVKV